VRERVVIPDLAEDAARMDEELAKAVKLAAEQIAAEAASATDTPSRPAGYDAPIFNDTLPPNAKYDPAQLPLVRSSSDPAAVSEEEWSATLVHGRSMQEPVYHKAVYGIPAASLHLRSYHQKYIDFFAHFASHAAAALGIPISKTVHLPTQRSLWTVPRSPFVHKKSQENFERRTHKRAIKAWDADPVVVDRWLQYLRKHALPGVGMRVARWHRLPLAFGDTRLESLMPSTAPRAGPSATIKKAAAKIVAKESRTEGAAPPPKQEKKEAEKA